MTLQSSAAILPAFRARYNSLVADGDKKGAYGLAAQLFDGTNLAEVSRLSEESFKLNMERLVRVCSSYVKETLKLQLCRCAPYLLKM